jgi:hypothetical protein
MAKKNYTSRGGEVERVLACRSSTTFNCDLTSNVLWGGLSLTHGWQLRIDSGLCMQEISVHHEVRSLDGGQRIWGNKMRQCRHAHGPSYYTQCVRLLKQHGSGYPPVVAKCSIWRPGKYKFRACWYDQPLGSITDHP